MKNKPVLCIFTDIHLKASDKRESILTYMQQGIDLCKENNLKDAFCLGDVFDSRVSQRQEVLVTWDQILDLFGQNGIMLHVIRGNHDSTDYRSSESFLTPYKNHPYIDLIDDIGVRNINGITYACIAFYEDDIWIERFEALKEQLADEDIKKVVLLSHIAITGSVNNDGTKIDSRIKPSMFTVFDKVFLGHYHQWQEPASNVAHLGSLQQNNFGEDEEKGFWLITEDLDYELFKLETAQNFKKLKIDLNETSQKQAMTIIEKFKKDNEGSRLRIELTGDTASIKAFDGSELKKNGIDIKKKFSEVDYEDTEEGEIKTASIEEVKEKFKLFCKENDYEYEEGLKILEMATK